MAKKRENGMTQRVEKKKKGMDLTRLGPCIAKRLVIDLRVNLRHN